MKYAVISYVQEDGVDNSSMESSVYTCDTYDEAVDTLKAVYNKVLKSEQDEPGFAGSDYTPDFATISFDNGKYKQKFEIVTVTDAKSILSELSSEREGED